MTFLKTAALPFQGLNREFWLEAEIDTSSLTIVADDVIQVFNLAAGWRVLRTNIKVVTPATGTALTLDVGLAAGSEFDAACDLKAAAGTEYESVDGTDSGAAGGAGTYFSTADTLDVSFPTVTAVTVNPVFKVRALVRAIN